ncbi:MAG: hypothetical protein A4E28_00671 [Methanocella sp. PtaU1.Bin125]|nr:MAG: hypothetical protein A4E28_00671 [Methanocella sp. PtaU1.Bin125]
MEYEQVRELLRKWGITIVPKAAKRIRSYDVDTFRDMAKRTGQIDFDCDFSNGNCAGRAMGGNGCCTPDGCSLSLGYWRKEGGTLDEDTVRRISPFYDPKTGFLEDGMGCRLPRELMSPTCLVVHCSDLMMTDEDKILLAKIRYGDRMSP